MAETWDAPLKMDIKPAKVNPSACGGQAAAARLSIVKNGTMLISPVGKDRRTALWRSPRNRYATVLIAPSRMLWYTSAVGEKRPARNRLNTKAPITDPTH